MANNTVVKFKGIKETQATFLKFVQAQVKDTVLLAELGQLTADQIRNRTRGRLEDYKQPPLKESTVERRKMLIAAGNGFDGRLVQPKQSNLSLTGQLLDAIKFRVNNAQAKITIYLYRARHPMAGLRKDLLDNSKDNVDIKNDLEKLGREFFFVSDKLTALLESRIARSMRQRLSKFKNFKQNL